MLTGRSELLSAAFLLGAWLLLELGPSNTNIAFGLTLYAGALLSKESSLLFPVLLALSDWAFWGLNPLARGRRRVHALLWLCSGAYLGLRAMLLSRLMHGGTPYFVSRQTAMLTMPRFALEHYLWPSLTGLGLCSDYSRPLILDATTASVIAWLSLACLASLFSAAAINLARRRSVGSFWFLGPCLFLLPTSHLIFDLDTIGAERFLYIPTWGLAVGLGYAFERLYLWRQLWATIAASSVLAWYGGARFKRNQVWSSRLGYYQAAIACNPVSARARSALGASLIQAGRIAAGTIALNEASSLDPRSGSPGYNLARLAWQQGDTLKAERLVRHSLELEPENSDAWVLRAVIAQARKEPQEALRCLKIALDVNPDHSLAHFNMGRIYLDLEKPAQGLPHLARFVELAPDDPDATALADYLRAIHYVRSP